MVNWPYISRESFPCLHLIKKPYFNKLKIRKLSLFVNKPTLPCSKLTAMNFNAFRFCKTQILSKFLAYQDKDTFYI